MRPSLALRDRAIGRARAAAAIAVCLSPVLAPGAQAQERSTTADVVALTVCVIDADVRWAALAHLARGDDRSATLGAINATMPDEVYRAQAQRLIDEVYRNRPESPRGYVATRLEQCAAGAARRVNPKAADGCYQLTRYANDFFAARRAGIPLERTVATLKQLAAEQGLGADAEHRLAKLAASVYATTVEAPEFRSGLFFHCVMPAPRSQ
jgi:hypothetical protein